MKSVQAYQDRRAFGRRETHITASVRVGYRIYNCIIKDISEGGALLEFEREIELPQRLWLTWPDGPGEIVCEVRHKRANRAGVEFARPIALTMRISAPPATTPALQAAPPPKANASQPATRGADLVAERRNALRKGDHSKPATPANPSTASRQNSAQSLAEAPVGAEPAVPTAPFAVADAAQLPEPPRDASSILIAMHGELARQAEAILAGRARRGVPLPLAASAYAREETQAAERHAPASLDRVPLPLAASAYATEWPALPQTDTQAQPQLVPLPLAASAYAIERPMLPETDFVAHLGPMPLPLAASAYAVEPPARDPAATDLPHRVPGPLAARFYELSGPVSEEPVIHDVRAVPGPLPAHRYASALPAAVPAATGLTQVPPGLFARAYDAVRRRFGTSGP